MGADRGVRVEGEGGEGTCEGGTCDTKGGDASESLAERGSQHVREEGGEAGPAVVLAGHGETKKTGLWLSGLPPLTSTNIVEGREQKVWKMGPSEDRWKLRSATYSGIADAMADLWGGISQHSPSPAGTR